MKNRVTVAFFSCLVVILNGAIAQEAVDPSVRDSIRDTFNGSLTSVVSTYDSSDVPDLLAMLESEEEEEYWPRVVGVLGVVGDESIVDRLVEFIEEPVVGPVYISQARHDTRAQAIKSLGYVVAQTGSERALDYLIESLDDNVWRRRGVVGVIDYLDSYDSYDRQLSTYAIIGLALSGHARANDALRSIQQSPTSEQARLRDGLDDTLETWLEVHDEVSERGLLGL